MMLRKSSAAPKLVGLSNALNRPKADGLDQVYDHIFASIVDQRLPPGTKLNEEQIIRCRVIAAFLAKYEEQRVEHGLGMTHYAGQPRDRRLRALISAEA